MKRMTQFWAFIKKLAGLVGFNGNKIEVGNDLEVDGNLEVNSSIKAETLTDGTTTKTMTEVLAGGGSDAIGGELVISSNTYNLSIKNKRWTYSNGIFEVNVIVINDTGEARTVKGGDLAFKLTATELGTNLFNKLANVYKGHRLSGRASTTNFVPGGGYQATITGFNTTFDNNTTPTYVSFEPDGRGFALTSYDTPFVSATTATIKIYVG